MLTALTPSQPIEVFISYAHQDEELRDQLLTYLAMLEHQKLIAPWHGRKIMPGEDWEKVIDSHLNSAQLILLLLSPHFLASRYCYSVEFKRAMEREQAGEACVIPVILRPCEWQESPVGRLQALPKNGKPIVNWDRRDDAFLDVAKGIRRKIEMLSRTNRVDIAKEHLVDVPRPKPREDSASSSAFRTFTIILLSIIGLLTAATSFLIGPKSSQRARITITQVPPNDPVGDRDSRADIAGKVLEARPEEYRIVIYSFTDLWYVQPTTEHSKIEIKPDGTWSAEIQTGSKYTILLVPPNFQPPHKTNTRPAKLEGIVTYEEIEGEPAGPSAPPK
jgi:hypothetical protein